MENAVSWSIVNLNEEVGGLDRCHYAPTAECCPRDYLLPGLCNSYAAERRIVDGHKRLHLGVGQPSRSSPSCSFPRPANAACHSKRDSQLQEVKHQAIKFA